MIFELICGSISLAQKIIGKLNEDFDLNCERELDVLKFTFLRSQEIKWFRGILRMLKLQYGYGVIEVREYWE